jgi:exopolysaccharide biosynthesis predicted pyruvyltransferase EpsI
MDGGKHFKAILPVVDEQHVIVFGGGGNMIGHYPHLHQFLQRHKNRAEILVLPSTVAHLPGSKFDTTELLKTLGDNVSIMARERKTLEYLDRYQKNTVLQDDMALQIDKSYYNKYMGRGTGIGYFYRTDIEKTGITLPESNIDISREYMDWDCCRTIEGINKAAQQMFEHVSRYQEIHTNRLHVAITGAILNKNVNMYNNSYWKNEQVYKYTMHKFNNVKFCK